MIKNREQHEGDLTTISKIGTRDSATASLRLQTLLAELLLDCRDLLIAKQPAGPKAKAKKAR